MRKRKRDLPFRVLKRIFGNSDNQPVQSREATPPEPMPEPPNWLKQNDDTGQEHHHEHSHSHEHSHGHDHSDEPEKSEPKEEPTLSRVTVDAIETPNANAMKFSTNQTVSKSSFSASSVEEAKKHPLAEAIFTHEGVINVFGVNDFVTVLKSEESAWADLETPIINSIIETLS